MAVKLAGEFFRVLLEEAQKDERIVGDTEIIYLRAVLVTETNRRLSWTMKIQGGRLESVRENHDGSSRDESSSDQIPTVQTDERTVNEILAKTIAPLRAFMRGSIKITGDRDAWRILADPARRAAARVAPLLNDQLPWPTFAQIDFIQRGSTKWTPNLPKCQLCGTAFGVVFSRPHHCRVCGRVVCHECSPHALAGHRACESCYMSLAVEQKSSVNGGEGKTSGGSNRRLLGGPSASNLSTVSSSSSQDGSTHSHEKGRGPTILSRALDAIRRNETSAPIECAQTESKTEQLLRSTAISSLQETRALKKELEEIKSRAFSARSLIRHALLVGWFVLCWRSSASSALAWYMLMGFSSYWKHSLIGLGLTQTWSPIQNLMIVKSASPISFGLAVVVGCSQAIVHRAFQRLFRIYSTSFAIIAIYQTVKVVCDRVLKLSEKAKSTVFDRVDEFVAPMACDIVLELKSVFVKFGQYLGARSDIVPQKWSAVLAKLQDDMPCDSVTHVSRLLVEEGFNLEEDFDELDMTPVASASIAQVHRATFKGEKVAVKIQHERVEEMMKSDMKAFKRIMGLIVYLNPRFEIASQLLSAWETEMLKELDFTTEASNLTRVKHSCSTLQDVIVPDLVKSTKRVLIMRWVEGFKITDQIMLNLYGVDREALLNRCVQSYSHQIFLDGFFQADPHAGNLLLQPPSTSPRTFHGDDDDGNNQANAAKLVLLDFGMCVTLPQQTRIGYCKLLVALSHLSVSELSQAIALAGYENSQSSATPERDLEYFLFLLRDTGTREEARKESKAFQRMRTEQRKEDLAKLQNAKSNNKKSKPSSPEEKQANDEEDEDGENVPAEGRYFKQMPDSLLFLMRTLGLLRGLCTTLGTPTSYLENMVDYAKLALILDSLERIDDNKEEKLRLKKLNRLAQTDLERKIAKCVLDESERLEGGYQICVMQDSKVIVDLCGGTLSDCDAKQVLPETLFPLGDLTKSLSALAAIYALNEQKLELDQPILGPKNVGATVREALNHSATGMEDALGPSSFGHQLRAVSYDKTLMKVAKCASETSLKTNKSLWHTQSFGYEIDLALRNSLAVTTLVDQVKEKVIPQQVSREVLFGGIAQNTFEEDDFAKASHGYADAIRMAMASSASTRTGGSASDNSNPKSHPSLANLGPLPGRVVPDAAMMNDPSVRSCLLPSYGAFGTARGLCTVFDKAMKSIPLRFWEEKVGKIGGVEDNPLFGKVEWGLGFVLHKMKLPSQKSGIILSHHSFGGSYLLFIPERRIVITVLVSHLTIERELTMNVLKICCDHFGLPKQLAA